MVLLSNVLALTSPIYLAERVIKELSFAVPGLEEATIKKVDAGAIFSWGETDIDDPRSEIHERFDVGVHAYDGYFSIDTGKFTTAPLFADHLQQLLWRAGPRSRANFESGRRDAHKR